MAISGLPSGGLLELILRARGAYGGTYSHYFQGETAQRCLCGRLQFGLFDAQPRVVADDDYWQVHPACENARVKLLTTRREGDGNEEV